MADPLEDLRAAAGGASPAPATTTTTAPPAPEPSTASAGLLSTIESAGYNPSASSASEGLFGTIDSAQREQDTLEQGRRVFQELAESGTLEYRPDSRAMQSFVAFVSRLYHADSPDAQRAARKAAYEASDIVPHDVWDSYGLDRDFWQEVTTQEIREGDYSLGDAARDTFALADSATGGLLGKGLEFWDRSSQSVLRGLAETRRQVEDKGVAQGLSEGSGSIARAAGSGLAGKEAPEALDLDEDGILNLREVLGMDPEWGGRWAGLADTIGVALLDPTTYATLGTGSLARTGLGVASKMFGEDVARRIAVEGAERVLTQVQRRALRAELERVFAAGIRNGARLPRKNLRRVVDEAQGAALRADRTARALGRGTGGLQFAGRDVPGLTRAMRRSVDKLPGRRRVSITQEGLETTGRFADVPVDEALPDEALAASHAVANRTLPERPGVVNRAGEEVHTVGVRGADGALQGHLIIDTVDETIDLVHVAPEYRGQGVAQQLLRQVEELGYDLEQLVRNGRLTPDGRRLMENYFGAIGPAAHGMSVSVLRPGLAARAREFQPFADILDAVQPRAAVRRASGKAAAEEAYAARGLAEGTATAQTNDLVTRLSKAARKSEREMGRQESRNIVRRALDVTQDLEPGTARARAEGIAAELEKRNKKHTARYLRALLDARDEIDAASVRAGLPADRLREEYFPRVLTKEGEKAVARNPRLRRAMGLEQIDTPATAREQAFHKPRTFAPDADIESANRQARAVFGLKEGQDLFSDDALTAFAVRGQTAFHAAAHADFIRGLTEIVDRSGNQIVLVGTSPSVVEKAQKLGYAFEDTAMGRVWAPDEWLDEIRHVRDIISNDKSLRQWARFRSQWSGIWATYATVPLIDGLGFHARNAFGNIWNNFLAGVTNPKTYAEAARIQVGMRGVRRRMAKGASFDDALSSSRLSARQQRVLRSAREQGVLQSGFFADLAYDDLAIVRKNVLRRQLTPTDNVAAATGRALGLHVENNARLAHYIHHLDKSGSAQQAALSVKRYLFDYGDLTALERNWARSLNRFYTWTRKNMGLQMWALATRPGRVTALARAEGQVLDQEDSGANPDFNERRGVRLSDIFGLERTAVGIETPLDAAVDTLDPFVMALDLIPGLRDVIPGHGTGEETARGLLGLTAGGPVEFVNLIFEEATGTDTFTGADLPEDRDAEDNLLRLSNVIAPLWDQADRFASEITANEGWGPLGNEGTASKSDFTLRTMLVKALLGVQVYPLSDRTATNALWAQYEQLDAVIKGLQEKGIDVPTIEQLRRIGLVDEFDSDSAPRQSSEITQEAMGAVRPDMVPPEAADRLAEERAEELQANIDPDTGETHYQRVRDWARGNGFPDISDTGRIPFAAQAAFNAAHPSDQYVDPWDDEVHTEANVEEQVGPTTATVRQWILDRGGEVAATGRLPRQYQDAYNEAHPNDPYIDPWDD